MPTVRWSHPSVTPLLDAGDPAEIVVGRARQLVFEAIEAGWAGPPYDPIALADLRGLRVASNPEVVDARTTVGSDGRLLVEFNPNQPRGRRRYSIAHEIAHTLFADVAETVRHRSATPERRDDWQLEMLCNMGAAELLMPVGSLAPGTEVDLGIDAVLSLRNKFDVSVEAITLRLIRLARSSAGAFVASSLGSAAPYQLDYFVPSPTWALGRPSGPSTESAVRDCAAIGYTAKATEQWPGIAQNLHLEAVGIPPYPGQRLPRVAGVVWPTHSGSTKGAGVLHVRGSATEPRGIGPRLLVHVVNDRTPRWGGGFALEVARRWPHIQRDFIDWAVGQGGDLRLGSTRIAQASDDLHVASVVAQHGYGPSSRPRIRYGALETGLRAVADAVAAGHESVHAPRLGAGQAGGSWPVIEGLLVELLSARSIPVTVYTLPNAGVSEDGGAPTQLALGT